jgi:uncharacterized protein (TIGR03118 family)
MAGVGIVSLTLAGTTATASATSAAPPHRNAFKQVNLVSDVASSHPQLIDNQVKNPWGIALGPNTPLWVNNNFNPASNCGSDTCVPAADTLLKKIQLYRGANGKQKKITKDKLEVTASAPFGIVFNPTKSFQIKQNGVKAPARFLFDEGRIKPGTAAHPEPTELADITGWHNAGTPTPTTTVRKATKKGALHFGLTIVPLSKEGKHGPRLLAADGVNGVIDVYDGHFKKITKPNRFVDPKAAADKLAPYNVAFLKDRVYVAYAAEGGPDSKFTGGLSVFTPEGRFIKRLNNGPALVTPWGMAIAPEHWGRFGGALLVGNVDDGKINAFNRRNGHLLGTISDVSGKPLVNPGLWGLAFGNGTIGTKNTLLFAAGIGEEVGGLGDEVYEHGLIGLIKPVGHS